MYIAIYRAKNKRLQHLCNLQNIHYELKRRVAELDYFAAEGTLKKSEGENLSQNEMYIAVLADSYGRTEYTCFCNLTIEGTGGDIQKINVKGIDFKIILQTEVIKIPPATTLQMLLYTVVMEAINASVEHMPLTFSIDIQVPTVPIEEYDAQTKNVFAFLQFYLKYYQITLQMQLHVETNNLIIQFRQILEEKEIQLQDFQKVEIALPRADKATVNSTVAVVVAEDENKVEQIVKKVRYYLTNTEEIAEEGAVEVEQLPFPVITKYCKAKDFPTAQYNAIYALAENRYNACVSITCTPKDAISLQNLPLFTKLKIYDGKNAMRTLPLVEITVRVDSTGKKESVIQCGFQKKLLTEILQV